MEAGAKIDNLVLRSVRQRNFTEKEMPLLKNEGKIGRLVLDGVSAEVDYMFIGDKFGRYTILYSSKDGFSGRTQQLEYSIMVEDRDAPEISMKQTPVTTVKAGDVFVIPEFTVTDNCASAEETIVIKFIHTASGAYEHLPAESNSFRPTQAGEYRLVIYAVDPSGNLGSHIIEFTVTE